MREIIFLLDANLCPQFGLEVIGTLLPALYLPLIVQTDMKNGFIFMVVVDEILYRINTDFGEGINFIKFYVANISKEILKDLEKNEFKERYCSSILDDSKKLLPFKF